MKRCYTRVASAHFLVLGFRPFFLLASLYGIVAMSLWGLDLVGSGPELTPLWHGHEMIFGYTGAVIAGFVLTAASNWTRRPTLSGIPLAALALVWVIARLLVVLPVIPNGLTAAFCSGFFVLLLLIVAYRIIVARSYRNYPVVVMIAVLALLELVYWLVPAMRPRVLDAALLFILFLVALIGGRIIPAFTRNATPGLKVRASGQYRDWVSLAVLIILAILALAPGVPRAYFASVACVGALAHGLRMRGWGATHTHGRAILWSLHLSYAFLPIGLGLLAAWGFGAPIPFLVPLHVLAIGPLGLMTLAMMSRVSLGHTGRRIVASRATTVAYIRLVAALVLRSAGAWLRGASWQGMMLGAASLWCLAFLIFVVVYAPKLMGARADLAD